MILAASALAEEAVTYERLFGDAPEAQVATADASPAIPAWWLPTGALAVGVLVVWTRRARGAPTRGPVRVIAREALGDKSAIAVVEVEDADGERRRLLVGVGLGAPSLVADLGVVREVNVVEEVLAERNPFAAAARRAGLAC